MYIDTVCFCAPWKLPLSNRPTISDELASTPWTCSLRHEHCLLFISLASLPPNPILAQEGPLIHRLICPFAFVSFLKHNLSHEVKLEDCLKKYVLRPIVTEKEFQYYLTPVLGLTIHCPGIAKHICINGFLWKGACNLFIVLHIVYLCFPYTIIYAKKKNKVYL